jgi:hypothetical protein
MVGARSIRVVVAASVGMASSAVKSEISARNGAPRNLVSCHRNSTKESTWAVPLPLTPAQQKEAIRRRGQGATLD